MNQQDKALKLANEYRQTMPYDVMKDWGADVAVELRRQYQEIQELKKAKEELRKVLFACKLWHHGDAWRNSEDPKARSAWENQRNVIQTTFDKYKD